MSQTLHKYDPERLCTYLQHHVAEFSGLAEIVKFSDGQSNPTYKLTDTAGRHFVLRAKPPGTLLKSAHAVDREFRVMTRPIKTSGRTDVQILRVEERRKTNRQRCCRH